MTWSVSLQKFFSIYKFLKYDTKFQRYVVCSLLKKYVSLISWEHSIYIQISTKPKMYLNVAGRLGGAIKYGVHTSLTKSGKSQRKASGFHIIVDSYVTPKCIILKLWLLVWVRLRKEHPWRELRLQVVIKHVPLI